LAASPRIVEILKDDKQFDYFLRTAAAAALGEMKSADAVEALADALTDKAQMVAQQANKSIRIITGFDTGMSPTARILERREAHSKFLTWWRNHEDEVRTALGQPKAPPVPK
jgi:HEAT repeat protein